MDTSRTSAKREEFSIFFLSKKFMLRNIKDENFNITRNILKQKVIVIKIIKIIITISVE